MPEKGEICVETIDRISPNGNGIVEMEGEPDYVSLGPLSKRWVGETVKFRYTGGHGSEIISRHNPVSPNSSKKGNKNDHLSGHL